MTATTDAATQIERFNELVREREHELVDAEEEFDAQRIRIMDSLCDRLDDPESIDAGWFKAHGTGLLRVYRTMNTARRRLEEIREIGTAMRGDTRA